MLLTAPAVQTRASLPGDTSFLCRLYSTTRTGEFDALDPDTRRMLLDMQARAQQNSYELQYPGSEHRIVLVDDLPAGRIWIARTAAEHRLVDVSLLPGFRNAGIGSQLLRREMKLAAQAGKPLRIRVHRSNAGSLRFHLRLGFWITYQGPVYSELEWRSDK